MKHCSTWCRLDAYHIPSHASTRKLSSSHSSSWCRYRIRLEEGEKNKTIIIKNDKHRVFISGVAVTICFWTGKNLIPLELQITCECWHTKQYVCINKYKHRHQYKNGGVSGSAHMDGWMQTCFCKCNAYSLLFNMENKKALVLCSLASNHFSWGNPEAESQSLTIQATLKNKGLRSGVHIHVRYVPIALARFKLPLTRPACLKPPAFKIPSFSASRSGLWSLDKLYACIKKSKFIERFTYGFFPYQLYAFMSIYQDTTHQINT